jgi:flagellin
MLSIQTNIASLESQNAININTNFQNNTIEQLSTGYRINSSADDAAGLAVANTYTADTTELTQGVLNANNAVSALQIVDGGANNISQILDRLDTLATESASSTFAGDRSTLNNEYQGLLSEINQQAANVNLNTGGAYNTQLTTYVGGANNPADAQVTVDLSGASNAIDSTALGIQNTNVAGGGTELTNNAVNLNNTAVKFLSGNVNGSQTFTFNLDTGSSAGAQTVGIAVDGTVAGLTGDQVVTALNTSLQSYGISASIASDGYLSFSGSAAFTVTAGALAGGASNVVAAANSFATNSSNYNLDSSTGTGGNFAAFSDDGGLGTSASETVAFQTGSGPATNVTLNSGNAGNIGAAISYLNTQLAGTGIYAVTNTNLVNPSISFQSTNSFNVNETAYTQGANGGTGNLFGGTGPVAVIAPAPGSSNTGNAIAALAAIQTAVTNLGLVQGQIGAGINKLGYAVNLAQSQITNFSAAESGIRDANIAAEAANLTKAQVLQQASLAALAQANSAPQAVLALLKS